MEDYYYPKDFDIYKSMPCPFYSHEWDVMGDRDKLDVIRQVGNIIILTIKDGKKVCVDISDYDPEFNSKFGALL